MARKVSTRVQGSKLKARQGSEGGESFTVHGLNPENNLFSPTARISILSKKSQTSFMLGYRGEFGSRFIENALEAQVKFSF